MVRVVRAVFPKDNIYIHLRDTLGTIYQDELFADVYPKRGQPAYAPWHLALVTVFHFMENLTDRQAADAVRSWLDWKYALSLELTDPGFDHTVLSISNHDENSRQKGDGHGNICAGAWGMA
jgi:transposase